MPAPATDFEQALEDFLYSRDGDTDTTSKSPEEVLREAAEDPPEELTSGQTDAWRDILTRLSGATASGQMASLLGAAGTGKTFLLTRIAGRLEEMGLKVLAVAPTHQAVGQIEKLFSGDSITVNTIQSALGLRLQRDGRGGYQLVPEGEADVSQYDLIIADEASMIGRELWTHVEVSGYGSDLRWLFVGDPYQLPPVNEAPSPALEQPGAKLTEIVRQAQNNPIIDLATRIRNGGSFYPLPEETTNGELGIYQVRQHEATEKAARAIEKDPTGTRVLAWRNKAVGKWCRRIKNRLYPDAGRFAEGMHMLAREGYSPPDTPVIKFHTSALLEVKEARKTDTQLGSAGPRVPAWSLDLKEKASGQPHTGVYVPRGQGEQLLEDYTEKMAGQEQWSEYYEAKEQFAALRYSAASTVHKSQGQSHRTTLVDVSDLKACREEFQELAYVAATRPEKHLVLIV